MDKVAIVVAFLLIIVGIVSGINLRSQGAKVASTENSIEVDGEIILLDDVFGNLQKETVEVNNVNYSGVRLADIIELANVSEKESQHYVIIGESDYQQTVSWSDISKGILTEEKRVIFPDLPKKFWVKGVIRIEVVK